MKIKVNKDSLLKCLEVVVKAIPSKAFMPMEHNFFLDIKDSKCYAYARSGKIQIKGLFPVESKEDIQICVPGNILMNTVRLLRDEELVFNYNPEKFILNLVAGKKKYKITGVNPSEFNPSKVIDDNPISIKALASSILGPISTVSKIVKWDDMRNELSGVTLLSNEGSIDISGTHEAFYFHISKTGIETDKEFGIVLPKDLSIALSQTKGAGDANIIIGEKSISVSVDGFEFYSVLIDIRKVMNLEKFFELDEEKFLLIDKDEILMAVRRLTNYCEAGSGMIVSLEGNELKLFSENQGFGVDAEEVIDVTNKNTENIKLGIDVRYLLSILNNVSGSTIKLYMSHPKRPIYIRDADNLNEKWGCALMALVDKKD